MLQLLRREHAAPVAASAAAAEAEATTTTTTAAAAAAAATRGTGVGRGAAGLGLGLVLGLGRSIVPRTTRRLRVEAPAAGLRLVGCIAQGRSGVGVMVRLALALAVRVGVAAVVFDGGGGGPVLLARTAGDGFARVGARRGDDARSYRSRLELSTPSFLRLLRPQLRLPLLPLALRDRLPGELERRRERCTC